MTTQVAGVRFLQSPVTFTPMSQLTQTPPRALRSAVACTDPTCTSGAWEQVIEFDRLARSVSVRVGEDVPGTCLEFDCTWVRMLGLGVGPKYLVVADSLAFGPRPTAAQRPITTLLRVTASTYSIKRVRIMFGREDGAPGAQDFAPAQVQLDDLRATVLDAGAVAPPPAPPPAAPVVAIQEPADALVTDVRSLTVRARVTLSGAPTALCVAVDGPASLPADCPVQSTPGADGVAALFVRELALGAHRITVWARDAHGQVGSASIGVEIVRDLGVDVEADALDVSQAVQEYALPTHLRNDAPANGAVGYPHREFRYGGVPLVRDKETIVRLHARLTSSGRVGGDRLPAPRALLHGLRGGRPLPGSPLIARFTPAALDRTPLAQRRGTSGAAYEFVLPFEWPRGGRFELVGEVNPPGLPGGVGTFSECADCRFDNAYAMRMAFGDKRVVGVAALRVLYPGIRLPYSPYQAFHAFNRISPVRILVTPWIANIDASDVDPASSRASNDVVWRVQSVKDSIGIRQHTVGLHDGRFRGLTVTYGGFGGFLDLVPEDAAAASVNRPLTETGHELGHLFGYPHAGTMCPDDGTPGDWPPDQRGEIGGWALDSASRRPGQPSRVFGQPLGGLFEPPEGPDRVTLYDLMSYCVTDLTTESDAWIAVRRWRQMASGGYEASALRSGGARAARLSGAAAAVPGGGPDRSLAVTAIVEPDGSARIVDTRPSPSAVSRTQAGAPYTLTSVDASGDALASVSAAPVGLHNHGSKASEQRIVRAHLPLAARIGAVRVADAGGQVLATRPASRNAPRVALLAPRVGARVRGALRVAWRARDADGDRLRSSVELSTDGGRRWRVLAFDVSGSATRIPAALLPRTARGRVRVRVSDGLRTTTVRSGRISIAGHAPTLVPLVDAGDRQPGADERIALAAHAWDDAGRVLSGKALRWESGRRTLGYGEAISAPAAAIGSAVTVTARDHVGRSTRRRIAIRVRAVAPAFLRLSAPEFVKTSARRLTLRVAATLPASLVVATPGARTTTTRVDRATRRVTVTIKPGKTTLTLRLRLRAGGRTITVTLTIARRTD